MSRTYRRKNYEQAQNTSWDRYGNKVAGYYTESDGDWWKFSREMRTFRVPTLQEYYHEYWRIHGESRNANYWSPGKWYRLNRMKENRSINKQELARWIKNEEYEPLFEDNPRSCLWDWS
jgi:hypothetical protein